MENYFNTDTQIIEKIKQTTIQIQIINKIPKEKNKNYKKI